MDTHTQLQTDMWDEFQGCDYITQNYVAFTWISSHSNVNKWGCIVTQDMNSTILLLYCESVMQGSYKNDWNKWVWIILWWSGGDGEELGNWTSGGLSMSEDCSVLFIQKASRNFLYSWNSVLVTGSSVVSVVLFCACFLRKMVNLRSFSSCLLSFNPWVTKQKTPHMKPGSVHVACTDSLDRETIRERLHIGQEKIFAWHELVMLVMLSQLSS